MSSMRGAVRLETLDGEPMDSFINGSRLKRFHEPLTDDMLEHMHAAKTTKIALQQLKEQAQAKAKARAAKAKARRLKISMVKMRTLREEDYTEPLLVTIGMSSANINCTTILDSRADVNVMSQEVYQKLHVNKLLPLTAIFGSFTNTETECQGILTTTIYLEDTKEPCTFYVTTNEDCAH